MPTHTARQPRRRRPLQSKQYGPDAAQEFTLGAALAFAGVILLMLSSQGRSGIGADAAAPGNPLFGDSLALLTACFYAAYQLTMKRYRRGGSAPTGEGRGGEGGRTRWGAW